MKPKNPNHKRYRFNLGEKVIAKNDHFLQGATPDQEEFKIWSAGELLFIQGVVKHRGHVEFLVTKSYSDDWESIAHYDMPKHFRPLR